MIFIAYLWSILKGQDTWITPSNRDVTKDVSSRSGNTGVFKGGRCIPGILDTQTSGTRKEES